MIWLAIQKVESDGSGEKSAFDLRVFPFVVKFSGYKIPPIRPDASSYYSSICFFAFLFGFKKSVKGPLPIWSNPAIKLTQQIHLRAQSSNTLDCRKVNAPWASHCDESKALSCEELGQVQWLQSGSVGCV